MADRTPKPRNSKVFIVRTKKRKRFSKIPVVMSDFPVLRRIVAKGSPLYRILWAVAFLFCWTLCIYQVCDRIRFYVSAPIRTTVGISRNSSIRFPSLTACMLTWQANSLLHLRYDVAMNMSIDPCSINNFGIFDIVETSRGFNYSALMDAVSGKDFYFWCNHMDFPIKPDHWIRTCKISFFVNIAYSCATLETTSPHMVVNPRSEYQLVLQPPAENCSLSQRRDIFVTVHESLFDDGWKLWQTRAEKDIVLIENITSGTTEVIPLSITEFTYLNTMENPCIDDESYKRCFHRFIDDTAKKVGITCRLREWGPMDMQVCKSTKEALQSFYSMHEILGKKDISCPRRCKETIYRRGPGRVYTTHGSTHSPIGVAFLDNIVSVSEEYYAYELVSLLCDIGGNIGLFLGICVMSVFETVDVMVRHLSG